MLRRNPDGTPIHLRAKSQLHDSRPLHGFCKNGRGKTTPSGSVAIMQLTVENSGHTWSESVRSTALICVAFGSRGVIFHSVNEALFEQLLWTAEGESLDFKRDQYPFYRAADDEKSEMLKDILAFANSWRQTEAYILIGVEEVKGGNRAIVYGIVDHLNDADLQQFVSAKTQRPLAFSYSAFLFEGKHCGVIRIPVQERPVFLTKRYGKLEAEKVYIRRGSSTDQAKPDEIARMGFVVTAPAQPVFEVYLQPRVEGYPGSESLEIAAWISNLGKATADDVIFIVEKMPVGVFGVNYPNWNPTTTAYRGTALALKDPLHRGGKVFVCSVNLGAAKFIETLVQGGVEFKIKILARDQAPIDLHVAFGGSDFKSMIGKTATLCSVTE